MSQTQVEAAKKFIEDAEAKLLKVSVDASRADWVKATYITEDTEILAAEADERAINAMVELAKQATRFDNLRLPEDVARKLKLLKLSLTLATPADPKESAELTQIVSSLEGTYGKGKWCPPGKKSAWTSKTLPASWPTATTRKHCAMPGSAGTRFRVPCARISRAMLNWPTKVRENSASRTTARCGARNTDMPPDEFAQELDRLREQVRPLYVALHAYVRNKLREKYG